jgi:hypothetical protein
MMHQNPTASRQFDTPSVSVVAVDGAGEAPDHLAFYDSTSTQSWLAMDDPLDLRDYR